MNDELKEKLYKYLENKYGYIGFNKVTLIEDIILILNKEGYVVIKKDELDYMADQIQGLREKLAFASP